MMIFIALSFFSFGIMIYVFLKKISISSYIFFSPVFQNFSLLCSEQTVIFFLTFTFMMVITFLLTMNSLSLNIGSKETKI